MSTEDHIHVRLRDLLVPEQLLEQTGAFDNPLLVYSTRRSRRWWRRLARHLLELTLLILGFLIVISGGMVAQVLFRSGYYGRPTYFIPFDDDWLVLIVPLFTFLLLRYHLLINDQSHHIKTLRHNHLQQLLLTPLTSKDYFLHHYLFFCRQYRVIYGFIAVCIAGLVYVRVVAGGRGAANCVWSAIFLFWVVLATWVAGVGQYVFEWRWCAGGRWPALQSVLTWFLSLALGAAIIAAPLGMALVAVLVLAQAPLVLAAIFTAVFPVAVLLGVVALIHRLGKRTHEEALDLLWQRVARDDPDHEPRVRLRPGALAYFFPFGQPRLSASAARRAYLELARQNRFSPLPAALVTSLGFCASYIGYVFWLQTIEGSSVLPGLVVLRRLWAFSIAPLRLPELVLVAYACVVAFRVAQASRHSIFVSPRLLLDLHGRKVALLALLLAVAACGLHAYRYFGLLPEWGYPGVAGSYFVVSLPIVACISCIVSIMLWHVFFSLLTLWGGFAKSGGRGSSFLLASLVRALLLGLLTDLLLGYDRDILFEAAWPPSSLLMDHVSILRALLLIAIVALIVVPWIVPFALRR
ncbi:hypothetical protein ACFL34_05835, partial [Candidatus Sumerlaeota bacterium]